MKPVSTAHHEATDEAEAAGFGGQNKGFAVRQTSGQTPALPSGERGGSRRVT